MKHKFYSVFIILSVLAGLVWLSAEQAFAQGGVQGVVLGDGLPLAGVTVEFRLKPANGGILMETAVTNAQGFFQIDAITPTLLDVHVLPGAGFLPHAVQLDLNGHTSGVRDMGVIQLNSAVGGGSPEVDLYQVCISAQDMLGHRIAIDVKTSLAGLTGANFNTIRTTTQGDDWCSDSDGTRVFIRGPLNVTIDHEHLAQNAQYPSNHRETYADYIYTGSVSGDSSGTTETEARSSFIPEGDVRVVIKYVESESGIIPPDTEPTPSPTPGNGDSLGDFDADSDCMIGDSEFFSAIDQWISQAVDNVLFFQLVDAWIGQANVCGAVSAASRQQISVSMQSGFGVNFEAQGVSLGELAVRIFDTSGKLVAQLQSPSSTLRWNLMTAQGQRVANGVYFYRIQAVSNQGVGNQVAMGRLVVLR